MTSEKRLRLFVAIELPKAWKQALGELQERMKTVLASDPRTAGVRMRWVRPEGIHLTLKFIGEVEPGRLETVKAHLASAVPSMPAITLALGRAGTFTDRRSPRVIWAGVSTDEADALRQLAESIETWLAAAGVPRDHRGFRPHLTLTRLPEGLSDAQRQRGAELTTAVVLPEVAPFTVEHVSLMQSFIGPGGARYERLGSWPG